MGESRRALEGGEGARGRRKRIAAHNSVRRPAIRFVLDVSNRLARRSRERETVVHVFTFARQALSERPSVHGRRSRGRFRTQPRPSFHVISISSLPRARTASSCLSGRQLADRQSRARQFAAEPEGQRCHPVRRRRSSVRAG